MKPPPFSYAAPTTLAEAVGLLTEHAEDEPRVLAGGQSLIPLMNFRLAKPGYLIDLRKVAGLSGIRREGDVLVVGAMTRLAELERSPEAAMAAPLVAEAVGLVAHAPIRNRGTIGGNLAHADPASELPAIALAMQARMRIRSSGGEREIAASDFFVGALTTGLKADEMLVETVLPPPGPRTGACFKEVARRRGDFALAGVAAILSLDPEGRCVQIRLALCGVGDTPLDASPVASALIRQRCTDRAIEAVAAEVQGTIAPFGNVHASARYQRHIAAVLVRRALATARNRIADAP